MKVDHKPIFMGFFSRLQETLKKFPDVKNELLYQLHSSGRISERKYRAHKSRLIIWYYPTKIKLKIHNLCRIVSSNQPSKNQRLYFLLLWCRYDDRSPKTYRQKWWFALDPVIWLIMLPIYQLFIQRFFGLELDVEIWWFCDGLCRNR